jgi:DnaK suppressor protein
MPKTTKVKKKVTKTKAKVSKPKTKVAAKPKAAVKAPIKISKTYIPKDTEKYMCEKHKVFFQNEINRMEKRFS